MNEKKLFNSQSEQSIQIDQSISLKFRFLKPLMSNSETHFRKQSLMKENPKSSFRSSIFKHRISHQIENIQSHLKTNYSHQEILTQPKQFERMDTQSQNHQFNDPPSFLESAKFKQPIKRQQSMMDLQNENQLWTECRCLGHLISNRAYHEAVYFDGRMFIFGGRDIERGQYGDVILVSLDGEGEKFTYKWEVASTKSSPPALYGHTAVLYEDHMYVYGGRISPIQNSSKFYRFNLITFVWEYLADTKGFEILKLICRDVPKQIDGHSAVILENQMVIFGGYSCSPPSFQSCLQIYNFETKVWEVIKHSDSNWPCARSHHSATVLNDSMYIFGGKSKRELLNDLWKWDKYKWAQISLQEQSKIPCPRLGHKLTTLEDQIILFGGYGGLLNEKNDIWNFNLKWEEWNCLDSGFDFESHRINLEMNHSIKGNKKKKDTFAYIADDSNQNKEKLNQSFSKFHKQAANNQVRLPQILVQTENLFANGHHHLTHKGMKKKQFLQAFQMSNDEERDLLITTPTTRQLRQSIELMEKTDQFRMTNKKAAVIDLDIYMNQSNRPLARDGFTLIQIEQGWLMFGGDRNKVSFNDTWFLSKNYLNQII